MRGGVFMAAAQAASLVIVFAAVAMLGRLLRPADFGLVAMVAVFTNFANMFVNAGLTSATIQRDRLTPQQSSNLFWVAAVVGIAAAAVIASLAPLIAWFYGEPRLTPITVALSISFIVSGVTVQHQSLMRRAMQHRLLAISQVVAAAAGQGAGVALAWRWHGTESGYWALVAMPLATSVALAACVWIACPWRPGAWSSGAGTVSLVRFGANLTGANMMNYLVRSVDRMLIGWRFGDIPLGYYDRAHRMVIFPLGSLTPALSSVVVPAMSRVAHDKSLLSAAHRQVTRLILLGACPLVGMGLTAEWWVGVVLGPGWDETAEVFRPLAFAALFLPMSASLGWLFVAAGKADKLLRWSLLDTTLGVASFAIGLPWGPQGVGAAYVLMLGAVRFPGYLWWTWRCGLVECRPFIGEVLAATPMVLGVIAANAALRIAAADAVSDVQGAALSATVTLVVLAAFVFATPQGNRILTQLAEIGRSFYGSGSPTGSPVSSNAAPAKN